MFRNRAFFTRAVPRPAASSARLMLGFTTEAMCSYCASTLVCRTRSEHWRALRLGNIRGNALIGSRLAPWLGPCCVGWFSRPGRRSASTDGSDVSRLRQRRRMLGGTAGSFKTPCRNVSGVTSSRVRQQQPAPVRDYLRLRESICVRGCGLMGGGMQSPDISHDTDMVDSTHVLARRVAGWHTARAQRATGAYSAPYRDREGSARMGCIAGPFARVLPSFATVAD